jgi:two-component system chemotaxis response regulator CheY
MGTLKFIVIDDSMLTIKKLSSYLEAIGHEVIGSARTGAEALDLYREKKPDFVTMDITMPEVNGIDATKNILAEFPDANIIMVTSHGQEKMVIDAIESGAKGYILKPIKKEKLQETIARVLQEN